MFSLPGRFKLGKYLRKLYIGRNSVANPSKQKPNELFAFLAAGHAGLLGPRVLPQIDRLDSAILPTLICQMSNGKHWFRGGCLSVCLSLSSSQHSAS